MGNRIKDRTGERFGKLTVTSFCERKNNKTFWNVLCDCGNHDIARIDKLLAGMKKSCGCHTMRKELQQQTNVARESMKEKIELYENALYTILSKAIDKDQNEIANVVMDTFLGFDLMEEHLEDLQAGKEFFDKLKS